MAALFKSTGWHITLLAVVIMGLYSPSAGARQPETGITVTIENKITRSDTILTVPVIIDNTSEKPVGLRVYLDNVRRSPITAGLLLEETRAWVETETVTLKIPLKSDGDFSLRVIAFQQDTENNRPHIAPSKSDLAYIRLSADGDASLISHEDYTPLAAFDRNSGVWPTQHPHGQEVTSSADKGGVTKDGLALKSPVLNLGTVKATLNTSSANTAETDSSSKPEYITLYGKLETTLNGQTVPLHYTEISVYDHDPLSPDDLLGTVRTDNQGGYNIVVKNDDGPFGGGIDVYLYIHSQSSKVTLLYLVPDGEGGYVPAYYSWKSNTHDDLNQRMVNIDYTISSDQLASTIWAGANAAAWLTKSATGRDLSSVEVRYPSMFSGTYYLNGIINIDPNHGDSPETVGHEYGHAVMDQAYGSFPGGSGGAHSLCEAANPGLAWSEGFATWYGMAAWNEHGTISWHIGGNTVDVEHWWCGPQDANTDEGRSAAWLWDLYDIDMDDNGGNVARGRNGYSDNNQGAEIVGSKAIINALWARKQNNTLEYWNDLKARLIDAEKAPSDRISYYNYLITP